MTHSKGRQFEGELARGYKLMNPENLEFAELALRAQEEVLEKPSATKKRRPVSYSKVSGRL